MDERKKWVDRLVRIPNWIKAVGGFVTVLVSFILLVRDNYHLVIVILVFSLLFCILGVSIYVLFSKTPPLIEGGQGVYRFSSFRLLALTGIILTIPIILSTIIIQPAREFIVLSFVGTPTPTQSPISSVLPKPDELELYFSRETPGEPMIIVIPFTDEDNLGKSPEKRIERNILEIIDGLERYDNKQTEAREIGQTYNATVVVWGWYDELGIQSFAEIIKSTPIKRAIGKELPKIPNPEQLLFCLKEGAPNQATYLSFFALGLASYYVADFDQAIEFFDLASEIPVSEDCPSDVDEAILFRGKANMAAGYFNQAEEDISSFLEINPDSIDGHLAMGYLQSSGCLTGVSVGSNWDAVDEANTVLNLDDQNSDAYFLRGLAYFCELSDYEGEELDKYKEYATSDFIQAVTINPDYPDGYTYLALLQKDISALATGIEKYEQIIEIESNNCYLYSQLASSLATYKAMSYLEEEGCSYEIFLDPSWGISSNCDLREADIDYSRSFAYFDKAIELCPFAPYGFVERGILYGWIGECNLSDKDFDKAENMEPHPGGEEVILALREWNSTSCIQK
jgi:tetratricopeptide (TPR) repeat protein